MRKQRLAILSLGLGLALATSAQAASVDPKIPRYKKVSGISGNLNSVGSDTMNNEMALWGEGFRRFYPNVRIQVEGKGSSTAPPALIAGTAQLGPMSRKMKGREVDAFGRKFGYKPTRIRTSLDTLVVYVNKDNPIRGLTIQQVDAVFSKNRACGYPKDIRRWGQLGLKGNWASASISLYGRNSASGTYGYFKKHALCKGDYKDRVKEQPGSASVVQGITKDRYGIGYSGIGYKTSGVRAIPLAKKGAKNLIEPTYGNVLNGKYPLGRFLQVYINKTPGKPLDPLVLEFLRFVLSREGQEAVIKAGYDPLPYKVAVKELKKLQ